MNRITADLVFKDHPEGGGGGLRGYLTLTYVFEETVGRLLTLSGKRAQSTEDGKASVLFFGTFKGCPYTLYDYNQDRRIHIGGPFDVDLDVVGLQHALAEALAAVDPAGHRG